jgi:hypothetical protein
MALIRAEDFAREAARFSFNESRLFLEEIVEGLTMAIHYPGSGTTPLLFHKHLGVEKGT